MSGLPCPNCGSELVFLEQYRRNYCYTCGRYAPEGYGDRGAHQCPNCSGVLSFVAQYERLYCYRCNTYPSIEPSEPASESATPFGGGTASVVVEPSPPKEEYIQAVETPAVAPAEERAEEEIPDEEIRVEEPTVVPETPPLIRADILEAKKPVLMDLCKAHGLDPSGTKDQLRERLLSYLDEIEAASAATMEESAPEASSEPEEIVEPEEIPESAPSESLPDIAATAEEEIVPTEPVPRESASAPPVVQEQAVIEPEVRQEPAERWPAAQEPPRAEPVLIAGPAPVREVPRIEHPCPRCARELTYVSQYDRWYCYHCRAYAPAARSKNACPSCGASLRWIDQYQRWWCDSCRRYAPADLPKPHGATAATAVEPRTADATTAQVVAVHRHRNPGSGIGLVGLGLALFVLYEVVIDLPAMLAVDIGFIVTNDVAFALRFFAFALVATGAMIGLSAVRDRR